MKVIDIFCGAGGFSEGFRQAGFDIVWGIDKWEPAVTTHQSNHTNGQAVLDDVIRISLLPDEEFELVVPDSEIIIGSPPCVSFSNSNRSGKADKDEGIALIKAFFRIVARKKWKKSSILKYWIMENVPNSMKYIKDSYRAEELGIQRSNTLVVKNMYSKIYNAAKFGVPSRRKRYFCGDFPSPVETVNNNEEIVHLRHVLQYLGEPNEKYNSTIPDPNYEFSLPGHRVTDHHYIQKLANYQWETAKRLKQDKGYMGKMSFPENLDRPARTVMATMTFGARESMIFRNGSNGYRAPTIREVASLMSFPLDYKFFGKSIGIKYRLVGNAVPPKLAFAFAKAIKNEEGLLLTTGYSPLNHIGDKELIDFNGRKIPVPKEKPKHKNSRFKYHIPYLIIDTFRVELTNYHSDFLNHNYKWDIEIHKSQGPRARIYHPIITRDAFTNAEVEKIKKFLLFVNKKIVSFNEFQEIYCKTTLKRKSLGLIGPFELLDLVKEFITTSCVSSDINLDVKLDNEFSYLPKKIAMGYFVLTTICEEMGRISHEC